jgi:hypothetical protein
MSIRNRVAKPEWDTLYFFLDSSDTNLIQRFQEESHIAIPRHVRILCSEWVSYAQSLSSMSFKRDSELTRIESNALSYFSSLTSIVVSRHVQIQVGEVEPTEGRIKNRRRLNARRWSGDDRALAAGDGLGRISMIDMFIQTDCSKLSPAPLVATT